jgi:hypothetical protein
MEEEKKMGLTALVSQHEDQLEEDGAAPFEHHVTPVPTQVLARLDRFASTSLLATGLAHEIANPLAALVAALDWTKGASVAPARARRRRRRAARLDSSPTSSRRSSARRRSPR